MAWRPDETDDSPDLTPMIDVTFQLITFFMTAATLITAEKVEVQLPLADQAKVPEDAGRRDIITIEADGSLHYGMIRVSGAEDLGPMVRKGMESIPGYKINLRVDQNAPHKYVRDVMKVCAENGAFDVIFSAYQK